MCTWPWLNKYGCFLPHVCCAVNHWRALADGDVSYSMIMLNLSITRELFLNIKGYPNNITKNFQTAKMNLLLVLLFIFCPVWCRILAQFQSTSTFYTAPKYTITYCSKITNKTNTATFLENIPKDTKKQLVTNSNVLISWLLWQFNYKRCTKWCHPCSNWKWQGTRMYHIGNRLDVEFTRIKYLQSTFDYTTQPTQSFVPMYNTSLTLQYTCTQAHIHKTIKPCNEYMLPNFLSKLTTVHNNLQLWLKFSLYTFS